MLPLLSAQSLSDSNFLEAAEGAGVLPFELEGSPAVVTLGMGSHKRRGLLGYEVLLSWRQELHHFNQLPPAEQVV